MGGAWCTTTPITRLPDRARPDHLRASSVAGGQGRPWGPEAPETFRVSDGCCSRHPKWGVRRIRESVGAGGIGAPGGSGPRGAITRIRPGFHTGSLGGRGACLLGPLHEDLGAVAVGPDAHGLPSGGPGLIELVESCDATSCRSNGCGSQEFRFKAGASSQPERWPRCDCARPASGRSTRCRCGWSTRCSRVPRRSRGWSDLRATGAVPRVHGS